MFHYGLTLRPVGLGCLPLSIDAQEWEFTDKDTYLKENPSVNESNVRHGVVTVPVKIEESDASGYDLVLLNDIEAGGDMPKDFEQVIVNVCDEFYDQLDNQSDENRDRLLDEAQDGNFKNCIPLLRKFKGVYDVPVLNKALADVFC